MSPLDSWSLANFRLMCVDQLKRPHYYVAISWRAASPPDGHLSRNGLECAIILPLRSVLC